MARPRVAPPRVFPEATRAARPPAGAAGAVDAHRQTAFVLGEEADLIVRDLEAEGAIALASTGAKHRTQTMASALGLWSRAWLGRLEALHAVEWGNYAAAVTLVRAAADYQAAQLYLLRQDGAEWAEWLDQGGIVLAPEDHATEFRLHAFRAAEILAAHKILGPLYRATMDLSMPHFGATLLLAGNDSSPDRVLMTFGDRDFHLGLAELCLGWLLELAVAQADALIEFDTVFSVGEGAALQACATSARAVVSRRERCSLEAVDREGMKRYVVHNWRRSRGTAPKKLLL